MEDTVYIEFYNKFGDIISQKPFVKWDEKLFRCIFKNYEYNQSVNCGNEWVYESPKRDNGITDLEKFKDPLNRIGKVISVVSTGMVIQPLPWYKCVINQHTANELKLKPLLVSGTSYSDSDDCADIIYGGTYIDYSTLSNPISKIDISKDTKEVIYVDESIFKNNKDITDITGKDTLIMEEYQYITSVSGHVSTGLINSQFPENLISKINSLENDPVVVFNSTSIGDKKFDDLIHCTNNKRIVYLDKDKKYNILEKVYCIHSFDEVKLV